MYAPTLIPAAPQDQRCCLILFKSSTGNIQAQYITVPPDYPPEAFMQGVKDLYEARVSNPKRAYYRCMLLSMPVVSTVNIWKISNPPSPGQNAFIREVALDENLTAALRKPDRLAGVPVALFLRDYDSIFLDAHHNADLPTRAIMVHLQRDPVAARIAGTLVSAASLGIGIGIEAANL
ncbi:hypothetical protein EDB81DRAFT_761471 [Dactylonectria macrodidyma]|uniref:Uncharacterized protein n=1 Tax=Dactylonectria macrodidyma TaxID=307937 RepID=A0A9P9J4M0_9HYPO|nr:hypothetical protein EDB81DRAFT_761471 [Dactylonectria macrodidyma]